MKAALFDLDGTLVDSLSLTFEAYNLGFKSQGGRHHSPSEIMAHFGPSEDKIFARVLGESKVEGALNAYRTHLRDNLVKIPLFPGIEAVFQELERRQIPMAIVTGRGAESTEMILKNLGIRPRFFEVIANDHVPEPKPAPHGVLMVLKKLKVRPEHAIFVGDSGYDMEAARLSGAKGIAALWDALAIKKDLLKHRPLKIARTPTELLEIIQGLEL